MPKQLLTSRPVDCLPLVLVACLPVACLPGCRATHSPPKHDYRTVQASPTRDTARAAAQHDKALAILDNCQQGYVCECVKDALCNPCKAEKHLQDALISDVRYGPAHNTLGSLYYSQRKLYLAAWEFEYASRLMPERPEPLNNLGLVHEEAGNLGRAIVAYQEAVDLSPTSAEYLGNLARAHLRQGTSFDEVRYLLQQVVFHDTRPHWVDWAKTQLGTHPQTAGAVQTAVFGAPVDATGDAEEIAPPPAQAMPLQQGPAETPARDLPDDGAPPEVLPQLINPLSQGWYDEPVDRAKPRRLPTTGFTAPGRPRPAPPRPVLLQPLDNSGRGTAEPQ